MTDRHQSWRAEVDQTLIAERADLVRKTFEVPADLREMVDEASGLVQEGRFSGPDLRLIRRAANEIRVYFLGSIEAYLVSLDADAKTVKSNRESDHWMTVITYLSPAEASGWNLCPLASDGCRSACLGYAGHGSWSLSVQVARLRRSYLFMAHRPAFWVVLVADLIRYRNRARRAGVSLAYRFNGTSDIAIESAAPGPVWSIPDQWYDYTAMPGRAMAAAGRSDYRLTFSRKETTTDETMTAVLASGGTVAAVFEARPDRYLDAPVLDGDKHDMRFLDQPGSIVGLSPKGPAANDQSGFVIRAA